MSKTTIPTGGITADAIDGTLIADDAISEEHLDATAITGSTELAATPADTDEILISDAGTLKRIDFSYLKSVAGTARWSASRNSGQSVSQNTATTILFNVVTEATGVTSTLTSNGRITIGSGQEGWYLVTAINRYADGPTDGKEKLSIYWYDHSASSTETIGYAEMNTSGTYDTKVATGLKYLDTNDYVYCSVNQNNDSSANFIGGNGTAFYGIKIA